MIHPFFSLHTHGFIRAAVACPSVRVADPAFNAARTIEMARDAHVRGASLVLFPELGLSAYAIDDLLQQEALLSAVETALCELVKASRALQPIIVVGAPLRHRGRLYNCAVAILRGRVLAVTPKTYLPNYREFYEKRHFASGAFVSAEEITLAGQIAPFGSDVLLEASDFDGLAIHMEVCEDVWVPIPPSSRAALAGATVLLNLSASNAIVGKSDYRQTLCAAHSARCLAAYLYSAAGQGESTTDLAWDGEALIYENGDLLAKAPRFSDEPQMVVADIDLGRLLAERARQGTFGDCADVEAGATQYRRVEFELAAPRDVDLGLLRDVPRFPFVPNDEARLAELCFEAFNIQSHGLEQRLRAARIQKVVIGVSGGLDSTQALLVAVTAMERLGLPRTNILAYTLPAFATTDRTKNNAWRLMRAVGVAAQEIDASAACKQMLEDIGHPAARGAAVYDATYENVQAGARTSLLFRLANLHDAIVVGTGDLSELALGWCTYGVGDQMSHYNVNGSVPKTLIQHLIRWCARDARFGMETVSVLTDILATEISPELIPGEEAQRTEAFVGPYALQDFNLYYTTRYGFDPAKTAFLSWHAWRDSRAGQWPSVIADKDRVAFDLPEIKHWLTVFLRRFFATSQFKRTAVPNGPKVSSGGSLSPRGDWRAPSDSSPEAWLSALSSIP
ncbi:NAD(+) synthase [Methylocystis sp. MJC1]|jgi:NAD+ synthase (glutamine-hydrolysing)|uniref:NAD(+) synthase n=1 Tax=Methylocystis sp. MJC1 TaxID=2654282 RepID=UPI0013ECC9F3|nr:NAD(+) synthase [Methylocystis sp. MJC1]KAF2992749.1 Glutamine-dependent NAD(+) synthetase [Methylocystis sp. MJC1]MBU6526712.1 NAD(+) synthase [Methylocystis sp. MJC1]UZX13148.1 NAD(+) synthase [Methylocystis sp. MJC1]